MFLSSNKTCLGQIPFQHCSLALWDWESEPDHLHCRLPLRYLIFLQKEGKKVSLVCYFQYRNFEGALHFLEPPKFRRHQWLLFFPCLAISSSCQISVSLLSEYIHGNETDCEAVTAGCTGVKVEGFFPCPVKELPSKVGVVDTCRR